MTNRIAPLDGLMSSHQMFNASIPRNPILQNDFFEELYFSRHKKALNLATHFIFSFAGRPGSLLSAVGDTQVALYSKWAFDLTNSDDYLQISVIIRQPIYTRLGKSWLITT